MVQKRWATQACRSASMTGGKTAAASTRAASDETAEGDGVVGEGARGRGRRGDEARDGEDDEPRELEELVDVVGEGRGLRVGGGLARRGVLEAEVARNVHDDALDVERLRQDEPVEEVHGLGEDDLLVDGVAGDGGAENLLERGEDLERLRSAGSGVSRLAGEGLECESEEDEEECHGFVSIRDGGSGFDRVAVCFSEVGLAIERVEDDRAVFVNQAGDCFDQLEPRGLIEL